MYVLGRCHCQPLPIPLIDNFDFINSQLMRIMEEKYPLKSSLENNSTSTKKISFFRKKKMFFFGEINLIYYFCRKNKNNLDDTT